MGIITFILFTSIAIIVAVLIVYFTSPKPSKVCDMAFKRMTKSSISFNSQPSSIDVGDFNNDKQMDIVVTNTGTNTIGIFLSKNDGTFENQHTYSTGAQSRPCSIVVSDFNNDNHLDIAVANYDSHNIGVFLGHGNGTFDNQKIISTGSSRPLFITTGDFNRDNKSDIIVANNGTDNIGIFLGDGTGSFQLQATYSTGYDSLPYSLAVGDFNNDNQLDIAVVNYGIDNIGIFLGYDNGKFSKQTTYTTMHNSNPSSIATGDFNNDNQLDIIVANYGTGNIGIFFGYGNGTFAIQKTYSIGSNSYPQFITLGYINNDNYLDIVVTDFKNDQIHIILGYGNGNFSKLTTYDSITGSRPFMIAITDFDNDNQSDIAVANYGTNNVHVLNKYSSKPSARQTTYFVGPNSRPSSVVIYDFNKDGKFDIAVNNLNDDYVLILTGVDNGSFVSGERYSTGNGSSPHYLCIADLNNDTRMDIIVANIGNDSVGVLLAQNNGTFASIITYSTGIGSGPWVVTTGDVNNDKKLDIISANTGSNSVGILLGNGNGAFANLTTYPTGINSVPWSVTVGDINNDNHLDIVVSLTVPDSVGVFLGLGHGSFGMIMLYSTGLASSPFAVVLADFNRDNHQDIVVANTDHGNVGVFLGNGDGTFSKQTVYPTGIGSSPFTISIADFNDDNYNDIATISYTTDEVVILFGDDKGSFKLARMYSTGWGSSPYGIAVEDLNNDKHLEIVVTHWGTGYVGILTEYYAAEFAIQAAYLTGSALHPYSVAISDFNNDNQSDFVVANSGTDNLSIFLGLGNGTFTLELLYPIAKDSYPQYVIYGYINDDNYLDIVAVNSKSNTISVIMGYGNGTFAAQITYSTGNSSYPYAIAMGDFNNDHQQDLVVANTGTDSIGIFFGFDYRSFQNHTTFSNENTLRPIAVVTYDFNNDMYLDIAVIFLSNDILGVFLGHGDGSFSDIIIHSTGSNSLPSDLAVNDFNNDGKLDIVVVNYLTDNIGIFLGHGNGSFATMITYSIGNNSGSYSVAVADFNNDGQSDIVTGNYDSNNIAIFLAYGNGSFTLMMTYSTGSGSHPYSVTVGDLNNDDQLDIVVANFGTSNVGVFLGYGNGSFKSQVTYPTGYQAWSKWVIIEDFNNDNQSDIAVANLNNNNIGILLGYGNGTFATIKTYATGDGSIPIWISASDFNNDNVIDIAVVNNGASNVVVLFGFGDGSFLLGTAYPTGVGSRPSSLAIGDFNNDTRLDIIVANTLSDNIVVFLGYRSEPFAGVTKYITGIGSKPHSVAVNDLNSDGWSDIVVANYGTNNIMIFFARSNTVFDGQIIYSTEVNSAPYSLAIADFNNDDQLDIVVTNSEADNVVILLGYENETFDIGEIHSTGFRSLPYTVSTGDFNNDNKLDLVIVNSGTSTVLVLYGYGNGTFGNDTSYELGYGYYPYSVATADLNQDNRTDIVIACYGTDNIEILLKTC